ncbi:MAG: hypothetical protein HY268_00595 [Deltaproteobacteria bacterium]|nr:hypothetical protein [Deltaproteobacteria bacterium]
MKKHVWLLLMLSLVFLLARDTGQARAARASLTVAPYFTNSMVLQQGRAVPVWGTATAGSTITVSFQNPLTSQAMKTTPAASGKWMLSLNALAASSLPGTLTVNEGSTSLRFTDVVVGDVWVLSGQSNINVMLKDCDGGALAIQTSGDYSNIRLYLVPQTGPLTEKWKPSNSTNTPTWSGVGFFFARAFHNLLLDHQLSTIPLGLIQVAKNGTPISDWTTYGGSNNGRLYTEKIKPLQPFAIRGVIWYQGEDDGSKESTALRYYDMLPGLIANWRADWGQGEFPFDYVQLALITNRPTWAILRDAQVSTLDVTNKTAMACIIDVPTIPTSEIHPKDKEPVGERLALAALVQAHPELNNVVYSGPIRNVSQSVISGSAIVVKFDFPDAGLVTDDGLDPGPFMIAGADGIYYPATATISVPGDSVVVSNPSAVPNPTVVRYCWGSYPLCNLFNDNCGSA